ncbi:MAG: phosphoribosyltransferase [Chitinivibrionales bacterium]|nr:phosphoribosyltransferase [Chitinivibrionales bacterium]
MTHWRETGMDAYSDRRAAGRVLAEHLAPLVGPDNPAVYGLLRGGMPVAFEVALALKADLDVFVVQKIGAPMQPELAMGAVAQGDARVVNEEIATYLGVSPEQFEQAAREALSRVREREKAYRGDLPVIEPRGRTVVVVDDGLATGASMRAAVRAMRKLDAARVVVGVPVGSENAVDVLTQEADLVVCPMVPRMFMAVGRWYEDFGQTSDDEVRQLLAEGRERLSGMRA